MIHAYCLLLYSTCSWFLSWIQGLARRLGLLGVDIFFGYATIRCVRWMTGVPGLFTHIPIFLSLPAWLVRPIVITYFKLHLLGSCWDVCFRHLLTFAMSGFHAHCNRTGLRQGSSTPMISSLYEKTQSLFTRRSLFTVHCLFDKVLVMHSSAVRMVCVPRPTLHASTKERNIVKCKEQD
jgi:hypothetical protein